MAIYYSRHGETIWNKEGKIQGRIDIPLSQVGKEQALHLYSKIKDIHLDLIFSSPLSRAYETATIATKDKNIEIIKDDRLMEMNYGDFEGQDHNNLDVTTKKKMFAYRYPNGESYLDVAKRVYSFLDEIKAKYSDKDILVVSHYGVGRIFNSYFNDLTNEEFFEFKLKNCELKKYELKK